MSTFKFTTCASCRDGEIYEPDNCELVLVKDPDDGKIVRRGWLCADHISLYLDDGYIVKDA